jgi:hypothetical protein
MRRLSVLLFVICWAWGAWHFSEEIALSRISQVTDLAISNNGEIWVLSPSAISRIDAKSGNTLLSREARNGRALAVFGDDVYYVDNRNRLLTYTTGNEENVVVTGLDFNNPIQMSALSNDGNPGIAVLEPNRLVFATSFETIGSISVNADGFALIPMADYSDRRTPLFTRTGSRIYAWTGGRFTDTDSYSGKLIYSASDNVLDLCADSKGSLYVLFTDSIMVLSNEGDYKGKIGVGSVSSGSRIFARPADDNLLVFNRVTKSIQVVSEAVRKAEELIVLEKNRPNPVDNFTEIAFTLSEPLYLTITIYNLIGEPVKQIARDRYLEGTHRVIWNADDAQGNLVPNGVYFYRLESSKGVAIRQLIVLR